MSNCCASGCSCESSLQKKPIVIDFLYLDLSVCGRCRGTDEALEEAIDSVSSVLSSAGYEVTVNKVNVTTKEIAEMYKFVSSPTIRVNGNDIAAELKESLCEDCGTLCGDDVDCRVWVFNGIEYNSPPKELIVNAILKEVYGGRQQASNTETYTLPQNLENYFESKRRYEAQNRR